MAQMIKNLPSMQETKVQFLGWEDQLEKGMATHSSTLAWRIPWTEEPGGLQTMGLQKTGHDWATHTWWYSGVAVWLLRLGLNRLCRFCFLLLGCLLWAEAHHQAQPSSPEKARPERPSDHSLAEPPAAASIHRPAWVSPGVSTCSPAEPSDDCSPYHSPTATSWEKLCDNKAAMPLFLTSKPTKSLKMIVLNELVFGLHCYVLGQFVLQDQRESAFSPLTHLLTILAAHFHFWMFVLWLLKSISPWIDLFILYTYTHSCRGTATHVHTKSITWLRFIPQITFIKTSFLNWKKNLGLPGLSSLLKVTWLSNGPAGSQPRSSDTQSSPFPTNYFNFLLTSSNEMGQSFSSPEAINSESTKQGPGCNPCVAFWGDLWAPGKRGPQLDCLMEPRGVSEEGKLGRVKGAGLCLPSSSRACILKATC